MHLCFYHQVDVSGRWLSCTASHYSPYFSAAPLKCSYLQNGQQWLIFFPTNLYFSVAPLKHACLFLSLGWWLHCTALPPPLYFIFSSSTEIIHISSYLKIGQQWLCSYWSTMIMFFPSFIFSCSTESMHLCFCHWFYGCTSLYHCHLLRATHGDSLPCSRVSYYSCLGTGLQILLYTFVILLINYMFWSCLVIYIYYLCKYKRANM